MLRGKRIYLEPLDRRHIDGLVAAAAADPSLYRWSPVPQGKSQAAQYIETALAWRDAGSALAFRHCPDRGWRGCGFDAFLEPGAIVVAARAFLARPFFA